MEKISIRFKVSVKNKLGSEIAKFQIEASSKSEAEKIVQILISKDYTEKVSYKIS